MECREKELILTALKELTALIEHDRFDDALDSFEWHNQGYYPTIMIDKTAIGDMLLELSNKVWLKNVEPKLLEQ